MNPKTSQLGTAKIDELMQFSREQLLREARMAEESAAKISPEAFHGNKIESSDRYLMMHSSTGIQGKASAEEDENIDEDLEDIVDFFRSLQTSSPKALSVYEMVSICSEVSLSSTFRAPVTGALLAVAAWKTGNKKNSLAEKMLKMSPAQAEEVEASILRDGSKSSSFERLNIEENHFFDARSTAKQKPAA